METLYFLLFLFTSVGDLEGPIGVFRTIEECRTQGKQVGSSVWRKFECVPTTVAALRYYRGECLGRVEDCALLKRDNREQLQK